MQCTLTDNLIEGVKFLSLFVYFFPISSHYHAEVVYILIYSLHKGILTLCKCKGSAVDTVAPAGHLTECSMPSQPLRLYRFKDSAAPTDAVLNHYQRRYSIIQFSSRWYLCARKSPYALHSLSQKFPPRFL